ncbi:MAG: hypothetical protein H7A01_11645 [Hahellaceae bacterium]|nr:hypothetical protein [Hahellaceae bacterium]MCP5210029.1 hypothetical protein [Hahellaceae bacterium]
MKLSPLLTGESEPIALRSLSSLFYRRSKASILASFIRTKSNTVLSKELPIELLPYLRPGRIYNNGHITSQVEGSVVTVRLEDLSQYNLITSGDLPSEVGHYLTGGVGHARTGLFHQYPLANGCYLLLPSHEIVRALFVPSSFYINRVLSASGLNYLYEHFEPGEAKQRRICFTKQMPVSLLNNTFVTHFAWMVADPENIKSWSKIYTDSLSLPPAQRCLWCRPPAHKIVTLKVGCKQFGNYWLAQEIYGFTGFQLPFEFLSYTHPKLKERQRSSELIDHSDADDQERVRNQMDIGIEDYSDTAKFDTSPRQYRIPRTTLGFYSSVIIAEKEPTEAVSSQDTHSRSSQNYEGEVITETCHQPVSLMASQSCGDASPLILDGLNACEGEYDGSLEEIENAMVRVSQLAPQFQISSGLFELPVSGKKKFSQLSKGVARAAYVATIESPKGTSVLVEVDRSINHQISTVLIRTTPDKLVDLDSKINEVLKLIVDNSGSWPKEKLEKTVSDVGQIDFMHHRVPEEAKNPTDYWARRLVKKF